MPSKGQGVTLYEPSTKKMLTGLSAPEEKTLLQFLKEHKSFKVFVPSQKGLLINYNHLRYTCINSITFILIGENFLSQTPTPMSNNFFTACTYKKVVTITIGRTTCNMAKFSLSFSNTVDGEFFFFFRNHEKLAHNDTNDCLHSVISGVACTNAMNHKIILTCKFIT